jgi:hypothetical protein
MPARDCCEIQLWGVISGFVVPARELRNNSDPLSRHVRFTSKSGQTGRRFGMSALCQKRTYALQQKSNAIRSPRRRVTEVCPARSGPAPLRF